MNAFLWDRDLRRHYWTGQAFNPLASLTDFKMLEQGGVKVLWSSLHVPERDYFRCLPIRLAAHFTSGGRKLLKLNAWDVPARDDGRDGAPGGARRRSFEMARSNAELDRVLAAGRTAIVHTVEGGHVPRRRPRRRTTSTGASTRLEQLAERGVASLTLAHLFPNDLAGHAEGIPGGQPGPALAAGRPKVDLSRGLTRDGPGGGRADGRAADDPGRHPLHARRAARDLRAGRQPRSRSSPPTSACRR